MKTRRLHRITWCCIGLFTIWAAMSLSQSAKSAQSEAEKEKEKQQYMQKAREYQRKRIDKETGPILLQGTITDENGHSLDNVTVKASRIILSTEPGKDSKSIGVEFLISSPFSIELESCAAAHFEFRKKGYHTYKNHLSFATDSYQYSEPFPKVRYESRKKIYDDIHIVLRNASNAIKLSKFGSHLQIKANGDRKIEDLANPLKRGGKEVNYAYGAKYVKAGEAITSGALYLEYVSSKTKQPLLKNDGGDLIWPPGVDVYVVLDDGQEGGFIRVDSHKKLNAAVGPVEKRLFWHMMEAPEGPYEKRMKITRQDFNNKSHNDTKVYFYCKIRGNYGKGILDAAGYSEQMGFTVPISIYYNPDGSRNLESLETK